MEWDRTMKNIFFYHTPIGKIGIAESNNAITHVYFDEEIHEKDMEIKETPVLKEAGRQLMEYFEGIRKDFDLPLAPQGTAFQQKAWKALQEIPYGETRSYGDIAKRIGNPKACRAVGMANNRNPIGIIIPCHRVIGANGKLVGYGGGLHIKAYLLKLEKEKVNA